MSLVPEHIQKLAPYKPGMHIETAKRKYGLKKIIKLASNENPLGPSKKAILKIKKTLRKKFIDIDDCFKFYRDEN